MGRNTLPRLWIVLVAAGLVLALTKLQRLESAGYDYAVSRFHSSRIAPWPDDFVQVIVDREAIAELNSTREWPLQREVAAAIWDRLHALGAKTIVDDGLYVSRRADVDVRVIESMRHVLLPIGTTPRGTAGSVQVVRASLLPVRADDAPAHPIGSLDPPLPEFAAAARAVGHIIATPDSDDRLRRHDPILSVDGAALPSLALVAVAHQRGADLRTLRFTRDALDVDGLPRLPLRAGRLELELSSKTPQPVTIFALPLLRGPESELRPKVEGKLVLVYTDNPDDSWTTALSTKTRGGFVLAHAIRTIAAGHAPRFVPPWRVYLLLLGGVLVAAGALLRLRPWTIAATGLIAALVWVMGWALAFRFSDDYLPFVWPPAFLALSCAALALHVTFTRLGAAEARADAHQAPRGEIALVFTDVQGSTVLWERAPDAMRTALELHDALMREVLAEARGYEVKTEGDAFMIAFASAPSAAAWCLEVQTRLLTLSWPDALLVQADAREERDGDRLLWRGLRVRMGIHFGEPDPRVDPLTGRMDYFGPPVNRAARVSGSAHGGQIVASGDAWSKIEPVLRSLPSCRTRDLGRFFLKGLLAEERLIEIVPESLAARRFPPPKTADGPTGERPIVTRGG